MLQAQPVKGILHPKMKILSSFTHPQVRLGDMAQKIIKIIFLISVDIDNYHDKCQIFISFKC